MVSGEGQEVVATTLGSDGSVQVVTTPEGEYPQVETETQASTPKVDWDSDDNPWKATATKEAARASSFEGQAREQAELKAHLAGIRANQKEIATFLTDPDADPAKLRQKLLDMESANSEQLRNLSNTQVAEDYLADIQKAMEKAGISPDDKRVEEAIALWDEAGGIENPNDMRKLYRARNMAIGVADAALSATKDKELAAEKARAADFEFKFKVKNGLLDGTNPPGTPTGSLSASAYAERLKKGEAPPSAAEIDRMTAKYVGS